ncbi:NAD(P)/FAD-dependent oxidoreductase [Conexibacter sp. SYSU D00693]|uniref:flavin-containing monooxygenase n=1 Tax=Conexibacter sp. SYSU D00693 TaxID=2812560 RepID=UPI00196B89DF|nr:NAD(P)/FAD-dependent oxidoreductase [Conexibacter sp. SYSU D00693]
MTVLDQPTTAADPGTLPADVRVCVVGTGFSGLSMAVRLKRAGIHDFVVLEKAGDVGGTWRENDYPGCRCDVPSHVYSFSFAPNPAWSSTFSGQEEIHAYIRGVAEREGLLEHVRFHQEVQGADWDAEAQRWVVRTDKGQLRAQHLVAGLGPLHVPNVPQLPGIERFEGTTFHSAEWDHGHDLTGERVAVIGTGASAIQFVPAIQPQVGELHLFQRTAPWIMPRNERPLTQVEQAVYRRFPLAQKAMRQAIFLARETFLVFFLDAKRTKVPETIAKRYLRAVVKDRELRRKLTPDYRFGCKRALVSNEYLPALTKRNVEVHTEGIAEVRERSIVTKDGRELEVDTIIYGTGFHVTDMPAAALVRGAEGKTLAEDFDGSPHAYKGTTFAGFPNLYMLLGPNCGLGHNSVVLMAEAQADYVLRAIQHAGAHALGALQPRRDVQEAFVRRLDEAAQGTVWVAGGCESWYLDEKGRASTLWPHSVVRFQRLLRQFDPEAYVTEPVRAGAVPAGAAA